MIISVPYCHAAPLQLDLRLLLEYGRSFPFLLVPKVPAAARTMQTRTPVATGSVLVVHGGVTPLHVMLRFTVSKESYNLLLCCCCVTGCHST